MDNETNRPRVYVMQDGPYNYQTAEVFGKLIFCSTDEITMYQSERNEMITTVLRNRMDDYVPGLDYILIAGSPIALAHGLAVAYNKRKDECEHNLLKWDGQTQKYLPYKVKG